MKALLNISFGGLVGTYWSVYAAIYAFSSALLLGLGYSNSEIGVFLAVGNLISIFLQPLLGDLGDRSKKISQFGIMGSMMGMYLLIAIAIIFLRKSLVFSILFIASVFILMALQPFKNSIYFKLLECKENVNFGINFCMGSVFYAFACFILGDLSEKHGTIAITLINLISAVLLLLCIGAAQYGFTKACKRNGVSVGPSEDKTKQREISLKEFAKRNKLFMTLGAFIAILFSGNYVVTAFMLQIATNLGGDAGDLGNISALMALFEIVPALLFSRLIKRFRITTLIKVSAIGYVLKLVMIAFAPSLTLVYLSPLTQVIAQGLFVPAMMFYIDEIMEKGEAVKGQSVFTMTMTVGALCSSLFAGFAIDHFGMSITLLIAFSLALIGAFGIIILSEKAYRTDR